MGGPAVHYNIGVAAYKLSQFERAARAFEQVAGTPSMAALAHYNLGLIARAQNDAAAARGYFERAFAQTQDERLKTLTSAALEELNATAPAGGPLWAAFGAAGIGYDDNVALTANGQALGVARESDTYLDGLFVGSLQLNRDWRIDADVAYLKYGDLDEFDQLGIGAGVRYRKEIAGWTADIGAQQGITYIDGDRLDWRQSLFLQASHAFANVWGMRARYRLSNVDGADRYAGLDGVRHELSMRLTYANPGWTTAATYVFDVGDFESAALSASRHYVLVDARKFVTPIWTARATLGYRNSTYDDPSLGTENRVEFSAGVEYLLSDQWTVVAEYSYTDNDSDADELDYDRNRIQVGAEVTF
jgi:tetratricopeptide (TPR) repeat protein